MGLKQFAESILQWGTLLFVFCVGLGVLLVGVLYVVDRLQTTHSIRRNYPVFGRFRYFFEHLGEFFRQYFFAMDREELPFNRAERTWVYRAAKNVDTTIAFGSTRSLAIAGEPIFLNSAFPILSEEEIAAPPMLTIGANTCTQPFSTASIINISGMSFGALSKPAVRALAQGAQRAGIWLNTGEGGVSPYHLESSCDVVFQIGTAKYGVRSLDGKLCDDRLRQLANYPQIRMFEIKMSQGAKPGKGGILPAVKVSAEIARIRGIRVGEASISPNGQPDIRSIEQLLERIDHIRKVTGKPVGFKAVVGQLSFFRALFEAIQKDPTGMPDFITLDSADGGTGAAPQPLIDYVGLPIQESLALVVGLLREYGLRQSIKVIASGKLITPGRVAWALAVGADFVVSARGFMLALGCIQALQCNKNTCPTGITTHDPKRQRGLVSHDKAIRVANYAANLNRDISLIAHACGVPHPRLLGPQHVHLIDGKGGPSVDFSQYYPTCGL